MHKWFRIRNFERFQHYRDRRPPWIKLYRDLWDDPRFFSLREDERYVLLSLFVVASQNDNKIPDNSAWLARQCLTSPKTIARSIKALQTGTAPWIETLAIDASEMLATCSTATEQQKCRETETDIQREKTETERDSASASMFDQFWKLYPRKIGKLAALKAWSRIQPQNGQCEIIFAAIEKQKRSEQWLESNGKFIPHPATWLNQGRWDDETEKSLSLEERERLGEEHWRHVRANR